MRIKVPRETFCRAARPGDADLFWPILRKHDQREILAYCETLDEGVRESIAASSSTGACWAGFHGGRPVMVYGCLPIAESVLGGKVGRIWGLSTLYMDVTPGARMATAKVSKMFVGEMRLCYDRLENEVLAEYADSVRWLEWLGFFVDREHEVRRKGEVFWPFWWEK